MLYRKFCVKKCCIAAMLFYISANIFGRKNGRGAQGEKSIARFTIRVYGVRKKIENEKSFSLRFVL